MTENSIDNEISALFEISRRFSKINWRKKNAWGLQTSEIKLLLLLHDINSDGCEKGQTVSEISKNLHVTSPTVTQIVNNLIKKHYVQRSVDPEDRRVCYISLTGKGKEIARNKLEERASLLQGLLLHLGKEQSHQLVTILDQVLDYIENQESQNTDS